jgi:pyruvate dehydrogenase E1 component alpha subunit
VEEWKQRDPIKRFQAYLLEKSMLTEAEIEAVEKRIREEVDEAHAHAEAAPYPPAENAMFPVFAPLEE